MKIALSLCLFWGAMGFGQQTQPITIGQNIRLKSEILKKEISLSIHHPQKRRETLAPLPVLITFQTQFEQVTGAVIDLYRDHLIPEMMVVGVDNYEYGYLSPTKLPGRRRTGQADRFLNYIEAELMPYLQKNYTVSPYHIVFSNSWGGMFAIYALLSHPTVFNAAIASVPWLPYDGTQQFILNQSPTWLGKGTFNHTLFMAMDDENEILPAVETFVDILKNHPNSGIRWDYKHWPEEDHTSTPYRALYSGLRWIYKSWNHIPETLLQGDMAGVRKHENSLNAQFGYPVGLSPFAYLSASQKLKKATRYDEAEALLSLAEKAHPTYIMIPATLGQVYEASNQPEKAGLAYGRAYKLAVEQNHRNQKWLKTRVNAFKKD